MTFLVVHQSTAEAMVVEYADRAGAEAAALFLANTQGGSTRVFAAFELLGYVRARDVDVVPESHEEALPVCPNCGQWRHGGDCLNECTRRGFATSEEEDARG